MCLQNILAVEVDEANAALNNNWNLLSCGLDKTNPAMKKSNKQQLTAEEEEEKTEDTEPRIYLDEGQHVSEEKLVVVSEGATRVILPDAHSLPAEPAELNNTMWIHVDAMNKKIKIKKTPTRIQFRNAPVKWRHTYLCWYPLGASASGRGCRRTKITYSNDGQ